MKKKASCGNELSLPQLSTVSCPHCGLLLGRGAFLNTTDPCFDASWKDGDYVVVEGVRIDRNGALVLNSTEKTICQKCPVNRRDPRCPWPEDRRKKE